MKKKTIKLALPTPYVDDKEYAILEDMATDHGMTITELLTELITPSGDKAGRWMVLQLDNGTYKAFQAYYNDEEEHNAEEMIEACVNMEGAKLAEEMRKAKAGAASKKQTR